MVRHGVYSLYICVLPTKWARILEKRASSKLTILVSYCSFYSPHLFRHVCADFRRFLKCPHLTNHQNKNKTPRLPLVLFFHPTPFWLFGSFSTCVQNFVGSSSGSISQTSTTRTRHHAVHCSLQGRGRGSHRCHIPGEKPTRQCSVSNRSWSVPTTEEPSKLVHILGR